MGNDPAHLHLVNNMEDVTSGTLRLKRFAEIYKAKMAARPFMEIIARYQSMTEAGLLVSERETADLYLDTHRFNELLYPPVLAEAAMKK
jgi:hypothetical protein